MAKRIDVHHDHQGVARIQNLPAPASGSEPARKSDLDAALALRNYIDQPARAVEAANTNVAAPGATHDGVTLANGDRLFLAGQTTNTENGTYLYNGAATPLTRSTDTFSEGTVVIVAEGTAYSKSLWIQTTTNPVVGTTALTFYQFGSLVSAGTGLTLTGNVLSITAPVPVALGGTNATSTGAAKTSLGFSTKYTALFGDGATTSFPINHGLGNQFPVVLVVNVATLQPEDVQLTFTDTNHVQLDADSWAAAAPAANAYRVVCYG